VLFGGGLAVVGVFLEVGEEPAEGLLIVVVFLAFNDDLEEGIVH
jgi:hypothetical protein